jgi:uncharacterized protein (DUF2252 family)
VPKLPEPHHRQDVLNSRRELKMSRSAHAYVRGSTDQFYQWIQAHGEGIPVGPPIWICGDCHVGNLGPIGHHEGRTVVELRDLDQTVVGNPANDLLRLALSLAMAARSSDLPGVTTARITEDLVAGYERAFESETVDETVDKLPQPIRLVMKRAVRRTTKHLLRERIGKEKRKIALGPRFWPLDATERAAVASLVPLPAIHHLVTLLTDRSDDARIEFVDAAFWAKGCSSLGLWRVALLVEIVEQGKRGTEKRTPSLLDVKQAVAARTPWGGGQDPGISPGERVVRGANSLAPALGARMAWGEILNRSVFVRELLPQDLKVELDEISVESGREVAFYLGMVVGRAHARQLDAAGRRSWHAEISSRRRSKSLDAPGWLWEGLVKLVSVHEHAYLEHCRRYALAIDRVDEPGAAVEPSPALVAASDSPSMRSVTDAADAPDQPPFDPVVATE